MVEFCQIFFLSPNKKSFISDDRRSYKNGLKNKYAFYTSSPKYVKSAITKISQSKNVPKFAGWS